ncbi:NTP transferase domain-containing protein [bacterium]|nr:NTP transferase domain-containing protein [bacterium]
MAGPKRLAVILAGGSGTRFWPLSRADKPKQYLNLFGDRSLIQATYDRLKPLCAGGPVFVCSGKSQYALLDAQVPAAEHILEPCARNTGPAVALTTIDLLAKGYSDDTIVGIFPADHHIGDVPAFEKALELAYETAASTKGLVTLGIVPSCAHTGYGYIEAQGAAIGKATAAQRFVEKPDAERAKNFFESRKFFWNAGIFVWRLGSIREAYLEHARDTYEALSQAYEDGSLDKAYPKVVSTPVDKQILEKAKNVFVLPASMQWSDVGSWNALWELLGTGPTENSASSEKTLFLDSERCLVHAEGKKVALIGVQDLIVVVDGENILVTTRDQDQRVREVAETLSAKPS